MLFHPKNPISLGLIKIQGLIAKRHLLLAENIGKIIEQDLLSRHDLINALNTPEIHSKLKEAIEKELGNTVNNFLEKNPAFKLFLNDSIKNEIILLLLNQLEIALPTILKSTGTALENSLQIAEMVSNKIKNFDLDRLEELVYQISAKELRAIEIYGAVIGFAVGLSQIGLFYLFSQS